MGPKTSVTKSQKVEQSHDMKHPKFTNVKFLKDPKSDEQYFQTAVPIVSEAEYDNWVKRLKQIPSKSQSLMLPINHKFQKQGLCGSSGIARIDFQNYPFLLSDEIVNRESINHKQFEENQLWYLLFTLISAAKDFHISERKVGDIRPDNIFINEDGQVKIATQFSWPGQQVNYNRTFYQKQTTYLSPEEMKDIQFGKVQSSQQIGTSQAFSIGLTVLDAAILTDSKVIYLKNGKFDYNKLQERNKILWKSGYSELMCLVISNLTQSQSPNRCSCHEIYQWLIPYEEYISNLQDFEVTNLPDKINLTKLRIQGGEVIQSNLRGTIPFNPHEQIVNYLPDPRTFQVNNIPNFQQNLPVRTTVQPISNVSPPFLNDNNHNRMISQEIRPDWQQNSAYTVGQTKIIGPPISAEKMMAMKPQIQQTQIHQQIMGPQRQVQQIPQVNIGEYNGEKGYTNKVIVGDKQTNQSSADYSKALEKIDEQLKMSRKMFPS